MAQARRVVDRLAHPDGSDRAHASHRLHDGIDLLGGDEGDDTVVRTGERHGDRQVGKFRRLGLD